MLALNIMERSTCKALTTKGYQCKLKPSYGNYCTRHRDTVVKIIGESKIIDGGGVIKNVNLNMDIMGFELKGECQICLENVYDINSAELECSHYFHLNCVKELRGDACPVCRATLKTKLLNEKDLNIIRNRLASDIVETNRINATDFQRRYNEINLREESSDSSEEESDGRADAFIISLEEYIRHASRLIGMPPDELYLTMTSD